MKNTKIWLAVTGVLLVILGILCIVYPTATLFTLAWMIGLFTLCTGISKFIFAIQTSNMLPNSGVRILSGLLVFTILTYQPTGSQYSSESPSSLSAWLISLPFAVLRNSKK